MSGSDAFNGASSVQRSLARPGRRHGEILRIPPELWTVQKMMPPRNTRRGAPWFAALLSGHIGVRGSLGKRRRQRAYRNPPPPPAVSTSRIRAVGGVVSISSGWSVMA